MAPYVSIIVPAWNEEKRIAETLRALQQLSTIEGFAGRQELIVVDDGSRDQTYREAWPWVDRAIRHPRRYGKGAALTSGINHARGNILLFLDADLGKSAEYAPRLVLPIIRGQADMTIAKLEGPRKSGGFGLVKGLACQGIRHLSGYEAAAPLSGQRAIRADIMKQVGCLSRGFGVEVGLTIDAARLGCRIAELEIPFSHRFTGRDIEGFYRRGKQFVSVAMTLLHKWRDREPLC